MRACPRAIRVVVAAICLAVTLLPASPSPASAQTDNSWQEQTSGTAQMLWAVACTSKAVCYAGGDGGVIVATTNGGATWVVQPTGTTRSFSGIACPTRLECHAVAGEPNQLDQGVILATKNGGRSWVTQQYGHNSISLFDIACPTRTACYAVGAQGTILVTTNGGRSWKSRRSGTKQDLNGISCPTSRICYAVGGVQRNCNQQPASCKPSEGLVLLSRDAGRTWNTIWRTTLLIRISCPKAKNCVTVGSVIGFTRDGGKSWATPVSQPQDFIGHPWPVQDVACPNPRVCYGVQWPAMPGGSILVTGNAGHSWATAWNGSPERSLNGFRGITCPSVTTCYAVGWHGAVVAGTNLPSIPTS